VSPQRLFTFLVNASGAIMLVVYLLVALAQIRQRRSHDERGVTLPIRMWLYPWLSYFAVAGIVLVLASMLFRAAERAQLLGSALSVAVVLIAYRWRQRGVRITAGA
jgi:L-asparagine transporter-like permease